VGWPTLMNTNKSSVNATSDANPVPSPLGPAKGDKGPGPLMTPVVKLAPSLAFGLIGMLLASLLSILNEDVIVAALPDIRGAMSIGNDDGTWLTALYEATEVATMILAPWFGVTLSIKRFTIGAVLAVMFLGLLSPFAQNLASLYVLRALQGIAAGCLPPMLIMVALRYLPPKIKLYGLAGYALTATFTPALGTPIAALWTEYISWKMAFWQIVPLGMVSCVLIGLGIPSDPPKLERFASFNWTGLMLGYPAIAMLVIGLLQGDRLDWLNSTFICLMFYGGGLLFAAFIVNEWFHPLPFFKFQLLSRRNFAHGLITLAGAVVLLAGVSVIPSQYLAEIREYRPLQTTPLFLLVAIPLLVTLPMTAAILNRPQADHRWVMGIGLSLVATTCFLGSFMSADWIRDNFYTLQSLEIVAQPMLILAILMGVTTGLPPAEGPFASAMFNTVRTFAGAAATGLIEGVGTARERFHSNVLVDWLGNNALTTDQSVDRAHDLVELAHRIRQQAVVLTSADLYRVMGCIAIAFLLLIFVLPVRIYPPWCTTPPPAK
jgi:MFS transporter, DHA2 family, multidrug resistance protein